MGEYEDRYPDAYGRDEVPAPAAPSAERQDTRPGRVLVRDPGRDRSWRLFGTGPASEATAPRAAWRHAPSEPVQTPVQTSEPTLQPAAPAASPAPGSLSGTERDYRGVGPRGYIRSPARVYEDVCDRLTDNPLVDASDIEVLISGVEVVLAGSVENAIAAARAEATARGVPGVKTVRNTLTLRSAGER